MFLAARFCRKFSPKTVAVSAIGLTIILCIYYANYTTDIRSSGQGKPGEDSGGNGNSNEIPRAEKLYQFLMKRQAATESRSENSRFLVCPKLSPAEADINTVDVFKEFVFQPSWMKTKEYWDKTFEDRFERQKMDADRPPLKVIIIPHSHNDPGWLKTFENYFHYLSRQIMNNMVGKLQQYQNLTFIWSEMAFLNEWWEEAHPSKQRALRSLVQSGRLEITTGGWVMTDEANAHIFAMVDQLIEGHQWIQTNLGVKPKSGWSVDPFGHGSTQPFLLASSGIKGAVIQRIHYAWKQWLALKQYGDFRWIPNWSPADPAASLLTHNQPFDIYSIKHSCGPHPSNCLNFDFRKLAGEYTEYSVKAQPITDKNVKEKSELLLEQYAKTGSLFPHNVVLMPLGDDFRYNVAEEWDQQYTNYVKLIDYINSHRNLYKAEVKFGTPSEYFEEIQKRYDQYPTLKGDFYVYSDIFSEGRPAYWSGYFTTRPFMKILDRQLENNLRAAEILYTVALNRARQNKLLPYLKLLERDFEKLVKARRNLALFQHHDAITGTSKSHVMRDYGLKLFEGIRDTVNIQQNSIQSLLLPDFSLKPGSSVVLSDLERDSYDRLARKTPINIGPKSTRKIVLYNSLAQTQEHIVKIRTNTSSIRVLDDRGGVVVHQVNPVLDMSDGKLFIAADEFEVVFLAELAALSLSTYSLVHVPENEQKLATIYCNKCHRKTNIVTNADSSITVQSEILKSKFDIKGIPTGDIQLENLKLKLLFNGNTGFLKTVTRKHNPKIMQCAIQFAAYRSAQFHSGAYLFMPDPNERDIEKDVLQQYKDQMSVIITSGNVSSEISVIYGPFLTHSVTIYHLDKNVANGIQIENIVDFENPPKNRETELFMRVLSDVQNGEPPELYTDLNGFQMQKRVKVEKIGIEGNYFPITTMAYIQDENVRLSLLTDHAQGASAWLPGFLEVMLDRRTLYDDSRGMGEGLTDNRKTVHKSWLLIEDVKKRAPENPDAKSRGSPENRDELFEKGEILRSFNVPTEPVESKLETYSMPSLFANGISNALNYPAGVFILDAQREEVASRMVLIDKPFPCDLHLLTLRTQPDQVYAQFPSSSALLVLHRQGYDCSVNGNFTCDVSALRSTLQPVDVKEIQPKSLTGLYDDLKQKVNKISDIYLEPMTLKTFNLTFV